MRARDTRAWRAAPIGALIGALAVADAMPSRGWVSAQEPAAKARTVWDGVYTEGQAERGRAAYAQACASCHADDLRGRSTAPSLVEESFAFLWEDMSLGDLFDRTRTRMPSDRPGSLPGSTYADILAFIAQKNGYPAGRTELGDDLSQLKEIRITAKTR